MRYAPSLCWSTDARPPAAAETGASHHVVALDFFLKSTFSFDGILLGDWDSFDKFLATLPSVHKVFLGSITEEHMRRFVEAVVQPRMEHLRDRVEVKYGIYWVSPYKPFAHASSLFVPPGLHLSRGVSVFCLS